MEALGSNSLGRSLWQVDISEIIYSFERRKYFSGSSSVKNISSSKLRVGATEAEMTRSSLVKSLSHNIFPQKDEDYETVPGPSTPKLDYSTNIR